MFEERISILSFRTLMQPRHKSVQNSHPVIPVPEERINIHFIIKSTRCQSVGETEACFHDSIPSITSIRYREQAWVVRGGRESATPAAHKNREPRRRWLCLLMFGRTTPLTGGRMASISSTQSKDAWQNQDWLPVHLGRREENQSGRSNGSCLVPEQTKRLIRLQPLVLGFGHSHTGGTPVSQPGLPPARE